MKEIQERIREKKETTESAINRNECALEQTPKKGNTTVPDMIRNVEEEKEDEPIPETVFVVRHDKEESNNSPKDKSNKNKDYRAPLGMPNTQIKNL